MLVSWKSFEPLVQSDVGSCPSPGLVREARNAAIRFCEVTRCWTTVTAPVAVLLGEAFYVIGYDVGHEYVRAGGVLDVVWEWENNGNVQRKQLTPMTMQELKEKDSLWKTREGDPQHYFVVKPMAVRVWPIPQEAKGRLLIGLYMKPSRAGSQCPEFLLEDHGEDIAFGIKARVLSQQGKDWHNPALAEYNRSMFERAIASARSATATSGTNKPTVGRQPRNIYFPS